MLLFSYYIENEKDRAWFDSSNVFYAECDESETQFKNVRVVFKNGQQYQYEDVPVYDWTLFKNSDSQGKKLNELFKKNGYKYTKIENADIESLQEEYIFRTGNGYLLLANDETLKLLDNKDNVKYEMPKPNIEIIEHIKGMLESLGNIVKVKTI